MTDSFPRPAEPQEAFSLGIELHRGSRLGRYELLVPIASGGMAHVWLARMSGEFGFQRLVAVKLIRPEFASDWTLRHMFLDEARITARIRHRNVVEIIDLGEHESIVFQVMELVEGVSLHRLISYWAEGRKPGGVPESFVVRVVGDALRGLHAAHELTDDSGVPLGVVHRDVSPQNVLVGIDGVAKIADFGIAKALGRLSDETEAGQLKGRLAYMPPEQLARETIDRRSDVFSAGIVLWEALTGARLFRGTDVLDTADRIRTMPVSDPREVVSDVSEPVALVTMRALERQPEKRFSTAEEMADALEAASRPASRKALAQIVKELAPDFQRRLEQPTLEERIPEALVTASAEAKPDARGRGTKLGFVVAVGFVTLGVTALLGSRRASSDIPSMAARAPDPAPALSIDPDPDTHVPSIARPLASAVSTPSQHSPTQPTGRRTQPGPKPAASSMPSSGSPSSSSPRKLKFDNPYGQ